MFKFSRNLINQNQTGDLLKYITINDHKRAFLNRRPGSARRVAVIAIFASDDFFFMLGALIENRNR